MKKYPSVLYYSLARIFEAWKDDIDFDLSAEPMPALWHLLKFPITILIILTVWNLRDEDEGEAIWILLIAAVVAGIAFEITLTILRR